MEDGSMMSDDKMHMEIMHRGDDVEDHLATEHGDHN